MSTTHARLLIVPELLTDHRWTASIANVYPSAVTLDMSRIRAGESMSAWARRCVGELRDGAMRDAGEGWSWEDPWMVVGIGWGGCFAVELGLAALEQGAGPRACLVIGSCRSRESIRSLHRVAWRVMGWMPRPLLASLADRWLLGWRHDYAALRPEMREIVRTAREQCPAKSYRMLSRLLLGWERRRSEVEGSGLTIHQLHGRLDGLIPRPAMEDATILLQAGHLLHLSHPDELLRWLDAILRHDALERAHRR